MFRLEISTSVILAALPPAGAQRIEPLAEREQIQADSRIFDIAIARSRHQSWGEEFDDYLDQRLTGECRPMPQDPRCSLADELVDIFIRWDGGDRSLHGIALTRGDTLVIDPAADVHIALPAGISDYG